MRWLQSGLRRDICVIVADLDDPTGQQAKAALERHYDDRIRPKTFHGALDALVDKGFLSRTQDGLADRHALTEAGRRRLLDHHAWVTASIDGLDEDTKRKRDTADGDGTGAHGGDDGGGADTDAEGAGDGS